jgi:hypothetical protein
MYNYLPLNYSTDRDCITAYRKFFYILLYRVLHITRLSLYIGFSFGYIALLQNTFSVRVLVSLRNKHVRLMRKYISHGMSARIMSARISPVDVHIIRIMEKFCVAVSS